MNYSILLVALPFIFLAIFEYYRSNCKAEQEKYLTSLLSIRCGGSFGWSNYVIPFVRHEIYGNFLVIAYGNKKIVMPFEDIISLSRPWYLYGQQVRYVHTNREFPKNITVRAWRLDKLLEILREKGLKVKAS